LGDDDIDDANGDVANKDDANGDVAPGFGAGFGADDLVMDNDDNQDDEEDKMGHNYEDFGRIVGSANNPRNNPGGVVDGGVESSGEGEIVNASFSSEGGGGIMSLRWLLLQWQHLNVVRLLQLQLMVGGGGWGGTRRARALLIP
jgi:hypothetical protein